MSVNRYLANQIWQFREKLATGLGPDRVTIVAQLVKLRDEFEEVRDAVAGQKPDDEIVAELADVVVVCLMAAAALDVDAEDLLAMVRDKMEVNLRREWYATASGTARHTPEGSSESTVGPEQVMADLSSKKLLKAMASRGYTRTYAEKTYAEFHNMEDGRDYVTLTLLSSGQVGIRRLLRGKTTSLGVVDKIEEAVSAVRDAL